MLLTFGSIAAVPVESIKFHPFSIKYVYHFAYANAILNSSRSSAYQSHPKLAIKKSGAKVALTSTTSQTLPDLMPFK